MPEPDEFAETAVDLRDAFADLCAAGERQPGQRRALKAVLNELYRVQEYRTGNDDPAQAKRYFSRAENVDEGRTALGVVFLRGLLTHHLVKPAAPAMRPLYPREDLYPSDDLYPGDNLHWLSASDVRTAGLATHPAATRSLPFYDSHVSGRMVVPTLRTAIGFVLEDPVVVQLRYR